MSDQFRALAINVGANSTLPGIRGPVYPDGSFEYIPIPEREPTAASVPTYGDLDVTVPKDLVDTPVHLDPSFPEIDGVEHYTYGDEHAVKAGPISNLREGDVLYFYATLEPAGTAPPWMAPNWAACLIGEFQLVVDPLSDRALEEPPPSIAEAVRANAHMKREAPDAAVIVVGDPDHSKLYKEPVPLSGSTDGSNPNGLVTELSTDSGKGPWWRRPLRFREAGTEALVEAINDGPDHDWLHV